LSEIYRDSWLKIPELEKTVNCVTANFTKMEPDRFVVYLDYLSDKGWTVKELNEALDYLITEKNYPDFTINDLLSYRKKLYKHYSDIQYLIKNKGRCELDFVKVNYNGNVYFWDLKNGEIPPMFEFVKPDEIVIYCKDGNFERWNETKNGKCSFKNVSEEKFKTMTPEEKEGYFNIKFISFKEFLKTHPDTRKSLDRLFGKISDRSVVEKKKTETSADILLRKLRCAGLHPKEIADSLKMNFNQYSIGKKIFVDVNNRDKDKVNKIIQEVLNDYTKIL